MNQKWSKEELEQAFRKHEATVAAAASTGDWEPFVQLFVPDAEYHDPMVGVMRGHDEIRSWANATLAPFPGSAMQFPEAWHIIDEDRGWIVCELRNVMRDPGDGSVHEQSNITILRYAGDGLFLSEQDVYDPAAFIALIERWGRRSTELGSLTDDETAWFAQTMPTALDA
jgi:hypothetical protein